MDDRELIPPPELFEELQFQQESGGSASVARVTWS
jgi:hypothetical protein